MYNYVNALLDIFTFLDCETIVISNSPFNDEVFKTSIEKKYRCKIFERENKGIDFGAWQWAMEQNLVPEDTQHLLLVNDSVFGPLFNVQPVIEKMTNDPSIDFWGFSDSFEGEWHLQSYFMGFTRKAFTSPAFKSVFEQNFKSLAKKKIIESGEILLSQSLVNAGFRAKAYVSYDNFIEKAKGEFHNPAYYFWAELIGEFRFPFLKKDLVNNNPEFFDNILDVFEVIETKTNYPVDDIIEVVTDSRDTGAEKKDLGLRPMVICHMFFYDIALKFVDQLTILNQYNAIFLFNISAALNANRSFVRILRKIFPGCIIINSPNQGRDIGGKFAALNIALKLNIESDITLIIHDKKSVHIGEGELWRDELFKIIGNNLLPSIFETFRNNNEVGLICSGRFIQDEYNEKKDAFLCTSNQQIKTLLKKYGFTLRDHQYLAGNIFWIRTKLLKDFFRERSLFTIRGELEKGNALDFGKGTFIHSWERIMSWIATSQGYKIHGI